MIKVEQMTFNEWMEQFVPSEMGACKRKNAYTDEQKMIMHHAWSSALLLGRLDFVPLPPCSPEESRTEIPTMPGSNLHLTGFR
jgi:hypothetical protein